MIRRRLKCPTCKKAQDWDIKLARNWYIRCYTCGSEFDLEREKRPKTKKKPIKLRKPWVRA